MRSLFDWFDNRTNFRAGMARMLDEPLPAGTGWWFVTGSVLLFLLAIQMLTGVVLAMYYVPAPEFAYDSVRFIVSRLAFGRVLRGLHFFGASFIVVAAVVHMLRVVLFGSYKKPREVTWITGVLLLLVILGFALSGYLLPWDQRAYWATTVTINIARGTPIAGEWVAALMRGGSDLGALTLLRWYAAHVFLLPAAVVAFTVSHLYLMRRHGISGPVTPASGEPKAFYPFHALKDTIVVALVFAALLTLAITARVPLDAVADPADASYVPRPEWYFLSLFQLLKYFPGPLEPIATMVIPGLVVTALLLLPFLDRGRERRPLRRPFVTSAFGLGLVLVGALTWLGFRDTPKSSDPNAWSPLALAGYVFSQDRRCVSCHRVGGAGNPLDRTIARRDPGWLTGHVRDPQMVAPGLRPVPPGGMNETQASSVIAYMRRVRAGASPPAPSAEMRSAAIVYGRFCGTCHVIDGEGGTDGPDLSHVGVMRDATWLREWITDPTTIRFDANMPAFGDRLNDEEMTAIVTYLAGRQ
jgi:ubiquinol-cytochrome c reductase cytochrome b subunit